MFPPEKEKEEYLYSAFFAPRYTQCAQAWITQFYLQTTPCLPFLRGIHQMSPPQQLRQQTSNCSALLIYRPRKDERLSWPSWLTYSRWLTHISGHPSAASRAQDSESTSAKDRCSTAGLRHQLADRQTDRETDTERVLYLAGLVNWAARGGGDEARGFDERVREKRVKE